MTSRTETDLAWAAGIIDGEGCITLSRQRPGPEPRRDPRRHAWEERDWQQWNGRQYYDDNPDDETFTSRQMDDETAEEYAKREADDIAKGREAYLQAVKDGDRIYSSYARTEGGGWGGYRKPVPPPAHEDVPVEGDNGILYEEKEVSIVDGRVFRNSFYGAFVPRMRGRLWEARKAAERERGMVADDTTSETAVAIRDKKAEVDAAHQAQRERVGRLGTYESAAEADRKTDHTGAGRVAGARAAETVPVEEGRAVK